MHPQHRFKSTFLGQPLKINIIEGLVRLDMNHNELQLVAQFLVIAISEDGLVYLYFLSALRYSKCSNLGLMGSTAMTEHDFVNSWTSLASSLKLFASSFFGIGKKGAQAVQTEAKHHI